MGWCLNVFNQEISDYWSDDQLQCDIAVREATAVDKVLTAFGD